MISFRIEQFESESRRVILNNIKFYSCNKKFFHHSKDVRYVFDKKVEKNGVIESDIGFTNRK